MLGECNGQLADRFVERGALGAQLFEATSFRLESPFLCDLLLDRGLNLGTLCGFHVASLLFDAALGLGCDANISYGIPPMEQRERWREGIDLMLKAWTAKEFFAGNGKYLHVPNGD